MCYFATIGIPDAALKERCVPKRRGFHLFSYKNADLLNAVPLKHSLLALTSSGCSCKICKSTKNAAGEVVLRGDAVDFLKEIVGLYGATDFFVHWYSVDIETEVLRIERDGGLLVDQITNFRWLENRIVKIKRMSSKPCR